MKVVIALGGHALAPPGSTLEEQRDAVHGAVDALAEIVREHDVVITHGNGPQVGWLAALARQAGDPSPPFDVLGAESEGWVGYLLEQELANAVPGRDFATLLTQVEVAADDPAYDRPTKPIGPVLDAAAAEAARKAGATVAPAAGGEGFRQMVASPHPHRVVEIRTLQLLMRLGVVVICGGGGGIPVVREGDGRLVGAPAAVVDKDRTAALLGEELGAERLLLLTDVPCVYADWPDTARRIVSAPPHALNADAFEAGSMGPKVEAARHFVQGTGGAAAIGAVKDAAAMLRGEAGTRIDATAPNVVEG